MSYLPKGPLKFLVWWAIGMPRRIFTLCKRIMILMNNELSFTLNVRLIFTPLFGDYTVIGRMIGFVIRICQILGGLVFMSITTVATLSLPFGWWLLPCYSFTELGSLTFLLIGLAYVWWEIKSVNIPNKKIVQLEDPKNAHKTMRPAAKTLLTLLSSKPKMGMAALMKTPKVIYALQKCELLNDSLIKSLQDAARVDKNKLQEDMLAYAKDHGARYIELEHLFTAVLAQIPTIETILASHGGKLSVVEEVAKWNVQEREKLAKLYIWQDDYNMLYTGGIGKGMTGVITPTLDAISTDLTKEVQKGRLEKIIGRDKEIKQIAEMLTGSKDDILIIGEAGSGKTSVVKGIAHKIIEGTEYKALTNKRLVSLELGGLIAGTVTAGQIAQKINAVLNEVRRSRDIILFLDEIHNVVAGTGEAGAETSSIFAVLEPLIVNENVQVIGATTIRNYRKFIEPNGAFTRLFQVVEIAESSYEDTLEILKVKATELEKRHKVFITYPALVATVKLSEKLIHERVLPDKAIDVLGLASARVAGSSKHVSTTEIEKEVAEMTSIPVESVTDDEAEKLLKIEDKMREMVIGQDHALKQVSAALKRARVGIRDESKPIASFLFIGTTGVGKTQTAKALATHYFGKEEAMVRIDMSEYQQLDSLSRLIGAPDGSMRGILTDKVRSKPFALVLLDEIEKAHPNILLTFLQVLDDGHITDSFGSKIDFSNTVIIATSNVGTRAIQNIFSSGGNYEEMKNTAMAEVRKHFAPEFLNRFSSIIVFHPLSQDNVRNIALMLLKRVKNVAKEKGVTVTFRDELVNELMSRGFDPEWGARPLARVIEDSVESYLATKLLTEEIKKGDTVELGLEVFED